MYIVSKSTPHCDGGFSFWGTFAIHQPLIRVRRASHHGAGVLKGQVALLCVILEQPLVCVCALGGTASRGDARLGF